MMPRSELMCLLDEVLEQPRGTLVGDELLLGLPGWDSVALMGYIALLDQHFGVRVRGEQILECQSVNDLLDLAGEHVTV